MTGTDPHLLPLQDLDDAVELVDDPVACGVVRAALRDAGFTYAGVRDALGLDTVQREPAEVPYLLRRMPSDGGLGTLARLFMLGVPVSPGDADAALGGAAVAAARGIGLLVGRPQGVASSVAVVPSSEALLCSDWEREDRLPEHPEHVMGLAISSRTLARLVPRFRVASALDVGTGGGIQALVLAGHADRVVATDANPRALRIARLSAGLNGLANIDLRLGDMFAPVGGERFHLVVGNLPYIISPETTYLFRDGGRRGDDLSREAVASAPAHLAEGGVACLMVGWIHRADEEPWDALRPWVDGLGMDVLVLHHSSVDALEHAAGWNRHHWRHPERVADGMTRWLDHLRDLGAERIAWGAVVMRASGGELPWFAGLSLPVREIGPAAHHVERLMTAQDLLRALPGDVSLLDVVLEPAPDHTLTQTARLRGGEADVERAVLALDGGLHLRIALDEITAGLVGWLDGRVTLRDAALAATGDDGEAARLAQAALPALRRLIALGLLVPARP